MRTSETIKITRSYYSVDTMNTWKNMSSLSLHVCCVFMQLLNTRRCVHARQCDSKLYFRFFSSPFNPSERGWKICECERFHLRCILNMVKIVNSCFGKFSFSLFLLRRLPQTATATPVNACTYTYNTAAVKAKSWRSFVTNAWRLTYHCIMLYNFHSVD